VLPMVGAARRAGPADFRRTLVLPSAQRPPSPAVTTPWQGLRRTARYLRHAPDRGPEGRRRRLSRVAAGQRRPDRRALPDLVRPDLERRPRPRGLAALPGRRALQNHPDHPGWHHQRPLRARPHLCHHQRRGVAAAVPAAGLRCRGGRLRPRAGRQAARAVQDDTRVRQLPRTDVQAGCVCDLQPLDHRSAGDHLCHRPQGRLQPSPVEYRAGQYCPAPLARTPPDEPRCGVC